MCSVLKAYHITGETSGTEQAIYINASYADDCSKYLHDTASQWLKPPGLQSISKSVIER